MTALHRIAQASHNENNSGLSGHPSDQTGEELNAVKYYDYPWNYVIRANDPEIAEKIADSMEKLVGNGFIGYDYNTVKRHTLFQELEKIDFDIELLNEPCYGDCSSVAYCAIYSATHIPFTPLEDGNGTQLSPKVSMYDDYTMTDCEGMFSYVEKADFSTSEGLERGDILLKTIDKDENNHVAIWI